MPEPTTGTVTNPTEPTPAVNTPAPAPAAAAGTPQEPAPSGGATLLGTEPKPEGEPKPAEPTPAEPKPAEPAKPEGAPEKYEFVAPEGGEYDPQVLETFSKAAKDANLSQDAAQKLIDSMAPKLAQRQQEQVAAVQQGWIDASKADKEFGGDKLSENLGIAKKGYDQFSDPELRTLMEQTGLGNHPAIIRAWLKVGKAISEDKFVGGKATSSQSPEAVLYPTMNKK